MPNNCILASVAHTYFGWPLAINKLHLKQSYAHPSDTFKR